MVAMGMRRREEQRTRKQGPHKGSHPHSTH
jgi:hypothetical protein